MAQRESFKIMSILSSASFASSAYDDPFPVAGSECKALGTLH